MFCRFSSLLTGALLLPALAAAQLARVANSTVTLPADLPIATGYTTENALGTLTFSAPMVTATVTGETNRLFVAERGGAIQAVTSLSTTPAKTTYFSLTNLLAAGESLRTDGENGFLSLVFHPAFATNGIFFVYFSLQDSAGNAYQRLHRITVTTPAANTATIASHRALLTIRDRATNHNGGDLAFGADGCLYLSLGDEGNANDSFNNARFINQDAAAQRTGFWGKLLRLDVDRLAANLTPNPHVQNSAAYPSAFYNPQTGLSVADFKIPADNPFIGATTWHNAAIDPATVRTEIYATGLRNPFRWSFDPPTGRLFLGDVGQDLWEEVDIVHKGDDLGWSWREGLHAFTSGPSPTSPPASGWNPVPPIYEYDHVNDGAGSGNDAYVYGPNITGGMVCRGNRLPELYGAYIFADYGNGFIVALRENGGVWTTGQQRLATDNGIVDFGTDPRNNDVIFCDLNDGTVKRLARTGTTGTAPPATLSATGIFSSLATLTPNAGVVPYDPNVTFWSDYAVKSRWFCVKNLTDTVGFSADGNWTLPAAMVWVKHFDFDTTRGNSATRRKLETRLLVKTATDLYGLCYKWRADQSDADLVAEDGLSETVPSSSPPQVWRYPSRTECKTCHTPVAGFALSFNTRQMNRAHTYGAQAQNQIAALAGAGYFTALVTGLNTLPALSSASDVPARSRESRVRSYLAANCVQCHQPGGAAIGNWDARPATPTDSAALINGVLVNTLGDPALRWAVPGDTAHSMILKRLQGNGVPRMPPLATNERDLVAEQLITDWINLDLPTRQNFAQWQTAKFGTTTGNAAAAADPDGDGDTNLREFLLRTEPQTANLPFALALQITGGSYQLDFPLVANRALVIESSTDLQTWSPWNVPGNAPAFFATPQARTLLGPIDTPSRFFRARLTAP